MYMCDAGKEVELFIGRGDVVIFRGDIVHAGAEAAHGHFGRIHVYVDSQRVVHDRTTDFGTCAKHRAAVRASKRVKLVRDEN
mgnify:CR=1 FL=1